MDFCGCGEDIALKQMFEDEEEATFSTTTEGKEAYKPVQTRSIASRPIVDNREDIVVETVESDGTMERQTVFDPKGRDTPTPPEPDEIKSGEKTENSDTTIKTENKKGTKKLFKLPKLKKIRSKKI